MMKAITAVLQPSWSMSPNRGWHKVEYGDLLEWSSGLRAPSANKLMSLGRETVITPNPNARVKGLYRVWRQWL
jgi:hypothetical protein